MGDGEGMAGDEQPRPAGAAGDNGTVPATGHVEHPRQPEQAYQPDQPPPSEQQWSGQPSPWAPQSQAYPTGAYPPQPYPIQPYPTPPQPGQAGQPPQTGQPPQAGQPATPPYFQYTQPLPPTSSGGPSRRRLLVVAVVFGLLAALVGGGVGGAVGYRLALGGSVLGNPLPGADEAAAPRTAVERVAQKVLPSVVQLRVVAGPQAGAGSGMVLSPDGLILTNNHVVEAAAGGAGEIKAVFQDGRAVPATIVGRDPSSDLAVVQAQGVSGLTPIVLGNSDSVRVGQQTVAVGSPLGLGGTVTTGIISAVNRAVSVGRDAAEQDPGTVLNAIQTDAAINPGNSGGPLVDIEGRVIGINTAIASVGDGDQAGSVGLGFAIPINQAKRTAEELQKTGQATKPVLGVQVEVRSRLAPLTDPPGAKIVAISTPGGPADQAGLKAGDIVTEVNDRRITGGDELIAAIRSHAPGERVTLTLADGRTIAVTLGSEVVEVPR